MAGASTAAPLSPAGALYWNPATLSGLCRSELETGAELPIGNNVIRSGIPADTGTVTEDIERALVHAALGDR